MFREKRVRRTIIVFKVSKYGQSVSSYDLYLDTDEWCNYVSKLGLKDANYRYINERTIVIIKKEKDK
jgi:hypothetical protein